MPVTLPRRDSRAVVGTPAVGPLGGRPGFRNGLVYGVKGDDVTKRTGRPPVGDRAMTPAERQKRYRDKKRREREALPVVKRERRRKADRDRKRAERAAVKAVAVATLPAAPVMRFGLVAWCDALTVTKGEGEGGGRRTAPAAGVGAGLSEGCRGGKRRRRKD